LLIAEGDAWRHQRRVLAHAFAPRSMSVLAPHFARGAAEAVADLGANAHGPVDMLEVLHDASIKVAAKGMFSLEVDSHLAELRGFTTRYLRTLARPFTLDVLLPVSIPSPYDLLRRRFRAQWMGLIDRMIARRMAMPRNPTPIDFFDLLRDAYENDGGEEAISSVLRDEVATMIVAGHETTSVTMFWTMYLLASFPSAQDNIAAEAAELALSPESAADDIGRLVYTKAVLSEGMRLYPAAFMIARQALADDVVAGIKVPAGSMVMISPWILHRHAANWKNPELFDPGRFLPGAAPPDRMSYLPFAVGPRVCIGAQFAMSEMTLMIASLVKAFRFSLDGDRPVLPVCVATTRPDHRPNFRVEARTTRYS
jgi:cytochrome P450